MALKLNPEPTFKSSVGIPVPGGKPEPVEFTFRHRKVSDLASFGDAIKGKPNAEVVLQCIVGWALTDEFNDENVGRLVDNYPGAATAIIDAYYRELANVRLGN